MGKRLKGGTEAGMEGGGGSVVATPHEVKLEGIGYTYSRYTSFAVSP